MSDYPRGFRNRFFRRCWLAVSDSLAITPALPVASSLFLPPSLDSSVAPSSATIAAPLAGIRRCNSAVRARRGQKRRSHPFSRQQRVRGRRPGGWPGSRSSAGSVESSSGPTGVWLPEAHALEGTSLLSGAQQVPVQRRLKSLSQSNLPPPRASRFLSPGERG